MLPCRNVADISARDMLAQHCQYLGQHHFWLCRQHVCRHVSDKPGWHTRVCRFGHFLTFKIPTFPWKNTPSCHQANKRYWNYQDDNILFSCFASSLFACVVACSCKEKYVVVDCLFWQSLPLWRVTFWKKFIFSQSSTNDKILHHEGVWQYPHMDMSKLWLSI